MATLSRKQIGFSGEFLAASVLQRIFPAIAFPQTSAHYDILCETKSGGFAKCQVKTTNGVEKKNKTEYYRWNTGGNIGGKLNTMYGDGEVDFYAFVCLCKNLVHFCNSEDVNTTYMRVRIEDMVEEKQEVSLKKLDEFWNN